VLSKDPILPLFLSSQAGMEPPSKEAVVMSFGHHFPCLYVKVVSVLFSW
jgi:hypothetical protein